MNEKRQHYQQIASLREYIVLSQVSVHAERWARNEKGEWVHEIVKNDIVVATLSASISLSELYASAGLASLGRI